MIRNQVNNTNQDLYMRVSLDKAVKAIYSNVKLEQIINEAIANSIDANATSIQIEITGKLPSSKLLRVKFSDFNHTFIVLNRKVFLQNNRVI